MVRNLCETVLRNRSFDPLVATNGLEGLELYRERHHEIALVLSDVLMPFMSGIEMTRKIFEIHCHANIILMSGADLHRLIPDEMHRLCSVLQKPFTPGILLDAVKRCLEYEAIHHPAGAAST